MGEAGKVTPMTAEAFLDWASRREGRYELADGVAVAMAPEMVRHARTKFRACSTLDRAIRKAGLGCEALIDGVGVRIDDTTLYIPDVLVRCGEVIDEDSLEVADPLIVLEVASESTGGIDLNRKFRDYFRLESLRHYLILLGPERGVIHHARTPGSEDILSRIHGEGEIRLDPPGLSVTVEEFYGIGG